jgi:hypothetical protein
VSRALLALAALLLAACTPKLPPEYVPPLLVCSNACETPCDRTVPAWTPPDVLDPAAWDLIKPQVVAPLKAKLDVCEERRAACVACMDEAERQGIVIRQDQ